MILWVLATALLSQASLSTIAEQSHFQRTGRFEEVIRLCSDFEKRHPGQVRCLRFGFTPEKRPQLALVASADGALTPEENRKRNRTVVFFQGGIHAGEIDGKDAGFLVLRELLEGKELPGILRQLTLVFIPVFNVDGHERFGRNNRPNQAGPEEMGWRVTSQNLNLNRDYVKAEAPEMQAMLALLRAWDPILYVDLHVTDGAKFQHDVAVLVQPMLKGPEPLRSLGHALSDQLLKGLSARGHLPLDFYPSFVDERDPASGFARNVALPRFSQGYWSSRNRIGVLVELHSWRPYPYRIKASKDTLYELLSAAARRGSEWRSAAASADDQDLHRGGTDLPLTFANTRQFKTLDYLGYAYTFTPSEISGSLWIRYDAQKPQIWKVPLYDELTADITTRLPKVGWVVPAAYADRVSAKLSAHGFSFERLKAPAHGVGLAFRASEATFAHKPFEGRQWATFVGTWAPVAMELTEGALFIPVAQPGLPLLAHLLEPTAPDSLAAWGYFNSVFEQKEAMESYVAEEEARKMLAQSPELQKEFVLKLATEPSFAADPRARLDFFYQRHPAFDAHFNTYPIFKVDSPL